MINGQSAGQIPKIRGFLISGKLLAGIFFMYGSFVVYVWRSVGGWRIFFFLKRSNVGFSMWQVLDRVRFGENSVRLGLYFDRQVAGIEESKDVK